MTTTDARLAFPAHAWPPLKEALQHIADHPDEFNMGEYKANRDWLGDLEIAEHERLTGLPFPACGTVACLAGRIAIIDDPERFGGSDGGVPGSDTALNALGLDDVAAADWDGYADPVSDALYRVFMLTDIVTYAELCDALTERFTFPEPLPSPGAVVDA